MDPPNPYKILKAEFDRNYAANRAPVGIWTHSSATGYLTKAYVFLLFLSSYHIQTTTLSL
jgi:hypothetical protein